MAIDITEKVVDILVNGTQEASYDQRANSAAYDVSVSSSFSNYQYQTIADVSLFSYSNWGTSDVDDRSDHTIDLGYVGNGNIRITASTNAGDAQGISISNDLEVIVDGTKVLTVDENDGTKTWTGTVSSTSSITARQNGGQPIPATVQIEVEVPQDTTITTGGVTQS